MRRFLFLLFTVMFCGSAALAQEPTMAAEGRAYCQRWGFQPRMVDINRQGANGATRTTKRMFVPITTQEQYEDFVQRCTGKACMIRWASDIRHPDVFVDKNAHQRYYQQPNQAGMSYPLSSAANKRGAVMAVALDPTRMNYVKSYLAQFHPAPSSGGAANTMYTAFQQKYGQAVADKHCMWWMNHMHVSDNTSISRYAGTSRARKPDTFVQRLMHFGNQHVGPVGVFVNTAQDLANQPDARLLGAPPAGTNNVY